MGRGLKLNAIPSHISYCKYSSNPCCTFQVSGIVTVDILRTENHNALAGTHTLVVSVVPLPIGHTSATWSNTRSSLSDQTPDICMARRFAPGCLEPPPTSRYRLHEMIELDRIKLTMTRPSFAICTLKSLVQHRHCLQMSVA